MASNPWISVVVREHRVTVSQGVLYTFNDDFITNLLSVESARRWKRLEQWSTFVDVAGKRTVAPVRLTVVKMARSCATLYSVDVR